MSSHDIGIHFFKKIEEDTLRNGELRIPRSFVTKYWEGISNPVLLLLPNDARWEVNWKKLDADVWLIDDWKKFADFFCLDQDHLLLFRYVRKSKFQVVIFDQNGLEIVYPLKKGTSDCEENGNPSAQSKRPKSSLPFSPSKKVKTNSTTEPSCNPGQDVENELAQSQGTKFNAEDFDNAKPEKRGGGRGIMHANTNRRCSKSKAIQSEELLEDTDNRSALERAKAFRSKNPFFIRQMHTTYIKKRLLYIPGNFITVDQQKEDDSVTLWISDRFWRVKFSLNRGNGQIVLTNGWMDFMKDNDLKIGNVCVFEQIKKPGISFRVVIHRDREVSSPSVFPAYEDGTNRSKQRDSDGISKKNSGTNIFDDGMVTTPERSEFCSYNNKVSENHFMLTISPIPLYSKSIPMGFIRNHDIDNIEKVILQVGERSWHVKLEYYSKLLCIFGSGWSEFMNECNLKVGDTCYFELIDKKEFVFDVQVRRFS